jgi:hypothetical protein
MYLINGVEERYTTGKYKNLPKIVSTQGYTPLAINPHKYILEHKPSFKIVYTGTLIEAIFPRYNRDTLFYGRGGKHVSWVAKVLPKTYKFSGEIV